MAEQPVLIELKPIRSFLFRTVMRLRGGPTIRDDDVDDKTLPSNINTFAIIIKRTGFGEAWLIF